MIHKKRKFHYFFCFYFLEKKFWIQKYHIYKTNLIKNKRKERNTRTYLPNKENFKIKLNVFILRTLKNLLKSNILRPLKNAHSNIHQKIILWETNWSNEVFSVKIFSMTTLCYHWSVQHHWGSSRCGTVHRNRNCTHKGPAHWAGRQCVWVLASQ